MKGLAALILPNLAFWGLIVVVALRRVRALEKGRIRMIELALLLLVLLALPIGPKLAAEAWRVAPFDASDPTSDQPASDQLASDQVVLIFGGGIATDGLGNYWPSPASRRRASVGFHLAQDRDLPVFLSGGPSRKDGPSEAAVMALLPEAEGLVLLLDEDSLSTWENALAMRAAQSAQGWDGIIAVTDGRHARRALASLKAAGVPVAGLRTPVRGFSVNGWDFVPSINGLAAWGGVGYELAASLSYILSGRIDLQDLRQ